MVPVGEAEDVIQETGVGSLSGCVHLLFICALVRKAESRNAAAGGR